MLCGAAWGSTRTGGVAMTPIATALLWISHLAEIEAETLLGIHSRAFVPPSEEDVDEADRRYEIVTASREDAHRGLATDDEQLEAEGRAWAAWCAT